MDYSDRPVERSDPAEWSLAHDDSLTNLESGLYVSFMLIFDITACYSGYLTVGNVSFHFHYINRYNS